MQGDEAGDRRDQSLVIGTVDQQPDVVAHGQIISRSVTASRAERPEEGDARDTSRNGRGRLSLRIA